MQRVYNLATLKLVHMLDTTKKIQALKSKTQNQITTHTAVTQTAFVLQMPLPRCLHRYLPSLQKIKEKRIPLTPILDNAHAGFQPIPCHRPFRFDRTFLERPP